MIKTITEPYQAGFNFIKALNNFVDEAPLKDTDQAVAYVWEYLEDALPRANKNAPMRNFMKEGEALNINRQFTGENNIISGGSMYMCIGKQLGIAFLKNVARGFVENLPDSARIVESEITVDGDWVSERVITKMPIELD